MKDSNLTVKEILDSPLFKPAIVVSGKAGLNKTVDWVHIIDTTYSRNYVNGYEMILTTGAGWKEKNDPLIFLDQLIEKKVTALCIQLGLNFNNFRSIDDIPSTMIEKSEANNFPLIAFPENYDCRFVDIVHNLHTMIINQSYKHYLEQENFLQNLYKILLNPHEIKDILYFLHRYLDVNVAYFPAQKKPFFAPHVSSLDQKLAIEAFNKMRSKSVYSMQKDSMSLAYREVKICKQDMACLLIFSNQRQLNTFEYLILDKCTIGLAQEYFSNIYIQERERQSRERWVGNWLKGQLNAQEILQKLQELDPFIQPSGCVICLVNFSVSKPRPKIHEEHMLKVISIMRSFLEKQGFYLLSKIEQQSIIFILLDKLDDLSWKTRLTNSLGQLDKILSFKSYQNFTGDISFSVGKMYTGLDQLQLSLENAKETLYVQQKTKNSTMLFFDELHIYRIIVSLEKVGALENFVSDYLKPVLKDRNEPDNRLIKTLIALRDSHYNKNKSAKYLSISRQSLYERVDVLEGLLGKDFTSSTQKRICLETALYGLEYLNSKDFLNNPKNL
ncbi:MAG: hypothetical protein AVO34_06465 [Firmicutes bacterium ML8_F2]|nr:MAG: hypothetical protein AVO34_06465 [Firmicutes bacterium ML8_F2]